MGCSCNNPALNDEAGVEKLNSLYQNGEVTFVEKLTNNLAAVGTGALIGGACVFGASKLLSGKKKSNKYIQTKKGRKILRHYKN
jgi:hypothetical protein